MDDLLLDSSYLFPIFGVRLEYRNFETIFPKLTEHYYVKYNPVSLIEAKWYVLKQLKKNRTHEDLLQSYRRGLASLAQDRTIETTRVTSEKVEELSDALLQQHSVQDYFDRLIYSTAAHIDSILLTEDDVLHNLFKKTTNEDLARPKKILRWKDLVVA